MLWTQPYYKQPSCRCAGHQPIRCDQAFVTKNLPIITSSRTARPRRSTAIQLLGFKVSRPVESRAARTNSRREGNRLQLCHHLCCLVSTRRPSHLSSELNEEESHLPVRRLWMLRQGSAGDRLQVAKVQQHRTLLEAPRVLPDSGIPRYA